MAESKNVCQVCGSGDGKCGSCGNMCGFHGAHIIRWILGIIIITWVFCIGMRVGEMKAMFEGSSYGYGHRYAPQMMYGGVQAGWANGGQNVIYSATAVPASPSTKAGTIQIKSI